MSLHKSLILNCQGPAPELIKRNYHFNPIGLTERNGYNNMEYRSYMMGLLIARVISINYVRKAYISTIIIKIINIYIRSLY